MRLRLVRIFVVLSGCWLAVGLAGPAAADSADGIRRLLLAPDDRAGWSPTQIFRSLRPGFHA